MAVSFSSQRNVTDDSRKSSMRLLTKLSSLLGLIAKKLKKPELARD